MILTSRRETVKRKEIWFSPEEWKVVEDKARSVYMKTGTYIRTEAVKGEINYFDLQKLGTIESTLRYIGNNINQLAKKANETNCIYAEDVDDLRKEVRRLSDTVNRFVCTET